MLGFELGDRCLGKHLDRGFGDARIAGRHFERVASCCDQLRAEREAALVDAAAHTIEDQLIILVRPLRPAQSPPARRPAAAGSKAVASIRPSSSSGRRPSCSASAGAWLRIVASICVKPGPCLQQPVEVDAAWQPPDQVVEAVHRPHAVGRAPKRRSVPAASPRKLRRRRQCAASGPCRCASFRSATPAAAGSSKPASVKPRLQRFGGRAAGLRLSRPPTGFRRVPPRPGHAAPSKAISAPPSARPCSRATLSRASRIGGKLWVWRSSTICRRCSIVRCRR